MLADGNGDYAKALGLEMDGRGFGMGMRGQRFALVVDDGVVKHVFIEAPKEFKVSVSRARAQPALSAASAALAESFRAELLDLRQQLEQIAHQAEVGHLEDRRFRILVDRDDRAGILDARQVLDRARRCRSATYSSGAMILPVCPTCSSFAA